MKKKESIAPYLGCVGVFDTNGILHIHPSLSAFKIEGKSEFPLMMVVGEEKDGDIILTPDGGRWISKLPRKFVKIIKT